MKCPDCQFEIDETEAARCPECGATVSSSASNEGASETFADDELAEHLHLHDDSAKTVQFSSDNIEDVVGTEIFELCDEEDVIDTQADRTVMLPSSEDDEPLDHPTETLPLVTPIQDHADQTVMLEGGVHEDSDKTVQFDSLSSGDADVCVDSDESFSIHANREELRTLEMNWDGQEQAGPARTLKGIQEDPRPHTTLPLGDPTKTIPTRTISPHSPTAPSIPEYELRKVLGEGGMGVVWSARQTSVDRQVAIKMIKGKAAKQAAHREKFLAEAIVTSDLDHPNIVPIYDLGNDPNGAIFYSMKQVQGTPWSEVFQKKSLQENLSILLRVADAVAFAHSRGIIHRDLKPENVMLGDYGEVLVMDWGLALPTKNYQKKDRVQTSQSMGGSPAYMAPEMATGPISRITPASDVYLLGATLWELLTGRPPHPGKTVSEALLSAMRNTIREVKHSGELISIAVKAMSSRPEDRYPSVVEFQSAIASYLDHSESLALTARAWADLDQAEHSNEYQDFSRAVFGFQQAHELWSGNNEARFGIDQANFAYAKSANGKGDYDLGLSLLSDDIDSHQTLRVEILEAKHERESRQRRLAVAKRTMNLMAAAFVISMSLAFVWIRSERNFAVEQGKIAVKERDRATEQEVIALRERDNADASRQVAENAKADLEVALDEVQQQRKIAVDERDNAKSQKLIAEQQREIAEMKEAEANAAREAEEYEAYTARVGLAAAKIQENAFDVALTLLNECPPEHRHWEWGRLMHLCQQVSTDLPVGAPVDGISFSPDGRLLLTASWDHKARIWDVAQQKVIAEFEQTGLYVHSAAWSPDQSLIALGGNDAEAKIRLIAVASGQTVATVNGHADAVVKVKFSPDGKQLLSCSYDETAKLWDLSDISHLHEIAELRGHSWWVWDGAFSADFDLRRATGKNRIVTVSQDGKAIVWSVEKLNEQPDPLSVVLSTEVDDEFRVRQEAVFLGHRGPVYSVAIAPQGGIVATGGLGNRVLLWKPDEIPTFDLGEVLGGEVPEQQFEVLEGHTSSVRTVQFSKTGDILISGGRDNSVKVWDVSTKTCLKSLRGHFGEIRSVDLSADGRTVASGSKDGHAILWNVDQYEEFRVLNGRDLTGHHDAVLSASYSAHGDRIVTASRDRSARIWDARTGQVSQVLDEGHRFLTSQAVFMQQGKVLVTAAVDSTVRFWDVASGSQILSLPSTGQSAVVAVSANEKWLATGSSGAHAQLWNLEEILAGRGDVVGNRSERPNPKSIELSGHHGRVTALCFSPNRDQLLTCDANGRSILWEIETQRPIWNVRHHSRLISQALFTTDGKEILTASHDHTVSRLDASTGKEIADRILKHENAVTSLAMSHDGQHVLTVSLTEHDLLQPGSRVTLWETATGRIVKSIESEEFSVNDACFVPTGQQALCVCSDNSVRTLDFTDQGEAKWGAKILDFQQLGGLVWSVKFHPDRKSIVTVGGTEVSIWDAVTLREEISFGPHGAVASACFSPDGQFVATGSWDNSIKVWNSATGQVVTKLQGGHHGYINSVSFDRSGQFVLTASDDRTAKLWDIATGQVVKEYVGHSGRVRMATFSPDGTRVLTVSSDRTARLWDYASAQQRHVYRGHEWAVLCGAFSPDGGRIVTGGEDNRARIWDVASGAEVGILVGHTAAVTSVCFSHDGRRIFTAGGDTSAKVWDATPGRMGTEILTFAQGASELTSIAVSPSGRELVTASRDGVATIWLTSPWTEPSR